MMMEAISCVFLGIKVKPGPIERFKLENYSLDNTVDNLKTEAEKKTNLPSSSLELIHHGKILKETDTLQDSGVKNGEMVYVVKKKEQQALPPPPRFTDAELQQLNSSLRTLGCTPNAPGWTRAMQLLNEEPVMSEIMDQAPSLAEDCVALSILHEVELLAALGANIQTMRQGANAHRELILAVRQLTQLVREGASDTPNNENVPTSGFAYSLEALSEDEDADEEETEETERSPITQEQLAAALQQAATEAVSPSGSRSGGSGGTAGGQDSLLRLLRGPAAATHLNRTAQTANARNEAVPLITPEMFSEAITEAMNRATTANPTGTPMEQTTEASSSSSPSMARNARQDYASQLNHMHEMGLLDDALNIRALLICAGDVNAAINLVFSGAIADV